MIMWSSFFALLGALAGAPLARTPCDLDTEQVHGTITLRAIYLSGYHDAMLYDPVCRTEDAYFEAICDISVEDCKAAWSLIFERGTQSEEYGTKRAEVLVRGNVVPWDGFGYGHLGGLRHRFEIYEVLDAKPVYESIPWPGDKGTKPAPMSEAVKALQAIDSQITTALVGGSVEPLGDLLAADFVHYPTGTNAEGFLKSLKPLCNTATTWWHRQPRVFARNSVAHTQSAYGCDSGGATVVYSHVYVRVGEQWRLAIRESHVR